MPDGQNTNGIGAAVKRREDFRFLTGQGRYTDDINRPGQTYAYILRSDQAHAKISVDTSAAAAAQRRQMYHCLLYTSPSPRDRG